MNRQICHAMVSRPCQSHEIGNLALALSRAQGEMGLAKRVKVNPSFDSTYSDLGACLDVCRKPLADNCLAIVQTVQAGKDGMMHLLTRLIHGKSGEWMESDYPVICQLDNPHAVGSALTYARRYSLCTMVGIASEDDDGELAVQGTNKGGDSVCKQNGKREKSGDAGEKLATQKQIETIEQMARERNLDVLEAVRKIFESTVSKLECLTKAEASQLITWMGQNQIHGKLEKAV